MKQYKTPTGERIVATLERVPGKCPVNGWRDNGEPEFAGSTEMFWDDQETMTAADGSMIGLDEAGREWPLSACTLVDESVFDEDEDEEEHQ